MGRKSGSSCPSLNDNDAERELDQIVRLDEAGYQRRIADQDWEGIRRYHDDALINSLIFDRHEEATTREVFARSIKLAGDQTLEDPLRIPLIPNWSRVLSALPDLFDLLLEAMEQDNT